MVGKQKRKRDEGRSNKRRRSILWLFALFGWLFFAGYWYLYTLSKLPHEYISDWSRQIVRYSALMEAHTFAPNLLVNPLFVIFVGVGVGIGISLLTRRLWLNLFAIPILLLMIPLAILFWGFLGLDWTTTLYPTDAISCDGHVYHLVYGEDNGDMLSEEYLLLFSCDKRGELCTSQMIAGYPSASPDSQFVIDDKTNELHVVSNNRIVHTLDDS